MRMRGNFIWLGLALVSMSASAQNTFPASGNVGIGTTNPGYLLSVGSGGSGKAVVYSQDNSYGQLQLGNPSSDGEASISFISGVTSFGYIPTSLHGETAIWDIGVGNWGTGNTKFNIGSQAYGGPIFTIQANGNIGVGTPNPGAQLDVNGNTRIAPTSAPWAEGLQFFMPKTSTWGGLRWSRNRANYDGNFYIGYTGSDATDDLVFGANSGGTQIDNILRLTKAGNVGIGTQSPVYRLDVNGVVNASAGIRFPDGNIQTVAFNPANCGADYAESVDVAGDRTKYGPGDVLVIDPNVPGSFLKSNEPYSTLAAGVYSTKPGFVGRKHPATDPSSANEVPMAMVGRVPTKVTAENGPIKVGDLLVTSSTTGYAMKGTDRGRMLGAVIGKALGSLDSGTGMIEVLVTLQ